MFANACTNGHLRSLVITKKNIYPQFAQMMNYLLERPTHKFERPTRYCAEDTQKSLFTRFTGRITHRAITAELLQCW